MGIEVVTFRKFERKSLQGFLTLHLTVIGLQIKDCTLNASNEKRWIGLPSKAYKDEAGVTKYAPILSFPDKTIYWAFQKAALEAVDKYLEFDQSAQKFSDSIATQDIPF